MRRTARLTDGRVPVTSAEKMQKNTKCFWKKKRAAGVTPAPSLHSVEEQSLSRIYREGFLLPLVQKQHFVLCALFIVETLLDKLLEGLINCKDLSVFPKQSRC